MSLRTTSIKSVKLKIIKIRTSCRYVCRIPLLQRNPNLSRTKPSTGPHGVGHSWSKDSYYSLESNKTLSHEVGLFGRLPGVMASSKCKQNLHKHTPIMSRNKNPTSKTGTIFLLQTIRLSTYLEGLNSSLPQTADELWPWLPSVGFEFLPTSCFLSHNFGSWYSGKPIKPSKDSDDNLVSKKNLEPKNGSFVWRPGPGNISQKVAETCPHYEVTHREPQTQNEKNFFQFKLEDLLNPYRVWIAL